MCLNKTNPRVNFFLQVWHSKGFSPVWFLTWSLRTSRLSNVLLQYWHLNSLSFKCVFMCLLSISTLVNFLLHSSHSKSLWRVVPSPSISKKPTLPSPVSMPSWTKANSCTSSPVFSIPLVASSGVTSMTLSTTPDTEVSRIRGVLDVSQVRLKGSPVSCPYISVPSSPNTGKLYSSWMAALSAGTITYHDPIITCNYWHYQGQEEI